MGIDGRPVGRRWRLSRRFGRFPSASCTLAAAASQAGQVPAQGGAEPGAFVFNGASAGFAEVRSGFALAYKGANGSREAFVAVDGGAVDGGCGVGGG